MAREEKDRPSGSQDTDRLPASDGSERGNADYPGRTIKDTAGSYSSVVPRQRGEPDSPLSVDPDDLDESGLPIPFTGDAASTRDATFEENPATGLTADEEEGEVVRHSLERRSRGYESG